MRCFWSYPLLCFAALYGAGCHSALDNAVESYTEARYPTAAAQFRALERTSRELRGRDFANYALYRGLTHLALGDARAAARWLGYVKQAARSIDRGLAQHGAHAGRARLRASPARLPSRALRPSCALSSSLSC